MPRDSLIKLRRGTAAAWTSANPTLAAGEPGYETDTKKLKIGDGTTAWGSLLYFGGTLVAGPSSATDSALALFDGTTGKLLKDSAKTLSTDGTLGSNSDGKVPTEKAVKTYIDGAVGGAGVSSIDGTGGPLTGDVTLSEGANVTLTQVGQNIEIAAAGPGGGSVTDVDSPSGTVDVTNGTGPTVSLEVHNPLTDDEKAALDGANSPDGSNPFATIADIGGGGGELDYVDRTTNLASNATSAATAATVLTGNTISLDGSTPIIVHFFCPSFTCSATSISCVIELFDGSTDLGQIVAGRAASGTSSNPGLNGFIRLTPSNGSHQYIAKAWLGASGTFTVVAAGGGATTNVPAFLRVYKA